MIKPFPHSESQRFRREDVEGPATERLTVINAGMPLMHLALTTQYGEIINPRISVIHPYEQTNVQPVQPVQEQAPAATNVVPMEQPVPTTVRPEIDYNELTAQQRLVDAQYNVGEAFRNAA